MAEMAIIMMCTHAHTHSCPRHESPRAKFRLFKHVPFRPKIASGGQAPIEQTPSPIVASAGLAMAWAPSLALSIALALCLVVSPAIAQFDQEFVDRHNFWRARVSPPAGMFWWDGER